MVSLLCGHFDGFVGESCVWRLSHTGHNYTVSLPCACADGFLSYLNWWKFCHIGHICTGFLQHERSDESLSPLMPWRIRHSADSDDSVATDRQKHRKWCQQCKTITDIKSMFVEHNHKCLVWLMCDHQLQARQRPKPPGVNSSRRPVDTFQSSPQGHVITLSVSETTIGRNGRKRNRLWWFYCQSNHKWGKNQAGVSLGARLHWQNIFYIFHIDVPQYGGLKLPTICNNEWLNK